MLVVFPYRAAKLISTLSASGSDKSAKADGKKDIDEGVLASVGCSLLMKVLRAARLPRPDLVRVVNYLATKVSEWMPKCDSRMRRLMGYIQATLHLRMIGVIGDSRDQLFPHVFVDADFAGDIDTQ